MERYDYHEAVKGSVQDWIEEHDGEIKEHGFTDRDELESWLYDEMFDADSVTGNRSGSYTCNGWKAEEYICHNIELAEEAYMEFGYEGIPYKRGAEVIDVTIRCYVLGEVICEALDEIEPSLLESYLSNEDDDTDDDM